MEEIEFEDRQKRLERRENETGWKEGGRRERGRERGKGGHSGWEKYNKCYMKV